MLNLANPQDRETLELQIREDINNFCLELYPQEHRKHLGASELGDPCWRKLWYIFRWVKRSNFDGRMMRLFNVGHQAEPRFIEYLRGIGFEVREFNDDGKQFRISGAKGHYGGSLDGMCKAPARYNLSEHLIFLNEFKTQNTGKGFNDVDDLGLQKAKPKHYKQMSQYGYKYNLKYGLYLIENKNDSYIKVKIVELDWNLGRELEHKAETIIFSSEPPPRISENPAFFDCKYCIFGEDGGKNDHKNNICHGCGVVEKNCRSCRASTPVDNGEWYCSVYNSVIPDEYIAKGCDNHNPI